MKRKGLYFSFEFVDKPKISKEINKLDRKKACQENDIPVKLIKSNKDLFSHFIFHNSNNSLFSSNFSLKLKSSRYSANIYKKNTSQILRAIVQLVLFLRSLTFMKDVCMRECINTLIKVFLSINPVLAKVMTLNFVYIWWFRNGKRCIIGGGWSRWYTTIESMQLLRLH